MTPTVDGSSGPGGFVPPGGPHPACRWHSRALRKGDVLYLAGDRLENVYRVYEGLVKVTVPGPAGRERILVLAGPGDLLGALGSYPSGVGESAEAISQQVLLRCASRDELMQDSVDEVLAAAAWRLESLRETLTESELPVTARLSRIFLRLGRRFGHHAEDGNVRLTLPLTHDHLAAMAGAARETTSTCLGDLRRAGLLKGTRGRYLFDAQRLEDFASACAA